MDDLGDRVVRVLLVAPHGGLRAGCRSVIELTDGFDVCGEAADLREVIPLIRTTCPDLVVVTLSFQYASDLALIRQIKAGAALPKVLVLAIRGDDDEAFVAHQCRAAGADLFVRNTGEAKQLTLAACEVMRDNGIPRSRCRAPVTAGV